MGMEDFIARDLLALDPALILAGFEWDEARKKKGGRR
jgi:hypothetical protein